ncbi:MAG: hypothetical protein HY788_10565 [Deltaproteobacteria bacterium]|nr:hypothetical protein [Deltaproteobacteria bacterium]
MHKEREVCRVPALIGRGVIGTAGFLLSPLSWWNDAFVNFPLAYGFAWVVGRFLNLFMAVHEWLFVNLFVAGYFMTNLAGFLMIHYSVFGFKKGETFSIWKQLFISVIYTLAILLFFGLDICRPEEGCRIFPSWVRP